MMSKQENVLNFLEEAKTNADLRAALADAGSGGGVIEVAKQYGYDFDLSDIADAARSKRGADEGALDDAAMSGISGGAGVDYTVDPMAYWGTSQWDDYWRGYPDEGERPRGRHG